MMGMVEQMGNANIIDEPNQQWEHKGIFMSM